MCRTLSVIQGIFKRIFTHGRNVQNIRNITIYRIFYFKNYFPYFLTHIESGSSKVRFLKRTECKSIDTYNFKRENRYVLFYCIGSGTYSKFSNRENWVQKYWLNEHNFVEIVDVFRIISGALYETRYLRISYFCACFLFSRKTEKLCSL